MSFSSDIKEELSRTVNHEKCCQMAELTGFLITNCNIVKENNIKIDLVWHQTHMVTNYNTCNFYYDNGVNYGKYTFRTN